MPQNATKRHKKPQNFCGREFRGKRSFFVKSFGGDRLIVSNGKTGKCHFVAGARGTRRTIPNLAFGAIF
jgi:hypothetical protein